MKKFDIDEFCIDDVLEKFAKKKKKKDKKEKKKKKKKHYESEVVEKLAKDVSKSKDEKSEDKMVIRISI